MAWRACSITVSADRFDSSADGPQATISSSAAASNRTAIDPFLMEWAEMVRAMVGFSGLMAGTVRAVGVAFHQQPPALVKILLMGSKDFWFIRHDD